MLEYKGYVGKIAYDDVLEVLYARVVNSGPYSIAEAEAEAEATDLEGVKREFRKSIDLYLASCAEDGVANRGTCQVPSERWVAQLAMKKDITELPPDVQAQIKALEDLPEDEIDTTDVPEILGWSGAKRGVFYQPVEQ